MLKIEIIPSILAADFGYLAREVARVEDSGADAVHVDIMDGHFVPNISFGPKFVSAIRKATKLPLDVHMMIDKPEDYLERFINCGANRITFHIESTEKPESIISKIKYFGSEAGIAISPKTSLDSVADFVKHIDQLLIMTVEPGFGNQSFISDVIEKIHLARELYPELPIGVDGGINYHTAKEVSNAGANRLVSGSFLFKQPDMKEGILLMREKAEISFQRQLE